MMVTITDCAILQKLAVKNNNFWGCHLWPPKKKQCGTIFFLKNIFFRNFHEQIYCYGKVIFLKYREFIVQKETSAVPWLKKQQNLYFIYKVAWHILPINSKARWRFKVSKNCNRQRQHNSLLYGPDIL